MFVHTRNKWYKKLGLTEIIDVFLPAPTDQGKYTYEEIQVHALPTQEIIKRLIKYDIVFIHLLHISHNPKIDGGIIFNWLLNNSFPFLLFIHGVEAQSIFKSRADDISLLNPKSIARWIYRDYYLLKRFSKILKKISEAKPSAIITPSKWMAKDVEFNTGIDISNAATIIPNGIDTELFHYRDDLWKNKGKILSLRPLYYKGKYATDLFIKTALISQDTNKFYLYGRGPDEKLIKEIIKNSNSANKILLNSQFIENSIIPSIHANHGIYYAVTRMDAQGVSMCEAMSSGLPVISFGTCAIPEFVINNESGYLIAPYDIRAANEKINELWDSKSTFERISLGARKSAETIDVRLTVTQEIQLGKKLSKNV